MIVPAISLWQPFASLIFVRVKRHETRGRPLPAGRRRTRHAIHATASFPAPRLISGELHRLCVATFGADYRYSLPLGRVLGTVEFVDSFPTEEREPFDEADLAAGDWSPGRFAWQLNAPIPLPEPLALRGRQSWFSVDL